MKELVEFIARALVEEPDAVEVREAGAGHALELRVAAPDFDRVTGQRGKTAHAIRTLLAAGATEAGPIELTILDPEESPAE